MQLEKKTKTCTFIIGYNGGGHWIQKILMSAYKRKVTELEQDLNASELIFKVIIHSCMCAENHSKRWHLIESLFWPFPSVIKHSQTSRHPVLLETHTHTHHEHVTLTGIKIIFQLCWIAACERVRGPARWPVTVLSVAVSLQGSTAAVRGGDRRPLAACSQLTPTVSRVEQVPPKHHVRSPLTEEGLNGRPLASWPFPLATQQEKWTEEGFPHWFCQWEKQTQTFTPLKHQNLLQVGFSSAL